MYNLCFSLGGGCTAMIGSGAVSALGSCAKDLIPGRRLALVTDDGVPQQHVEKCLGLLRGASFSAEAVVIASGETNKNLAAVEGVYSALYEAGFTREDGVAGLGGGVALDIAGFAAATYLRGLRFISVPTTIIAQVDSAYGGKTGVDFKEGKNYVGLFSHPKAIVCDSDMLLTLPERERVCGMGEVIKYGAIADPSILAQAGGGIPGEKTVFRCASIKKRFVEADEFDTGVRRVLNFGHTFGHAYEASSGYSVSHGQAVAYGMLAAIRLGERLGVTRPGTYTAVYEACEACGLDTDWESGSRAALELISKDKKSDGNRIDMVLLERPGRPVRMKLAPEDIRARMI